MFSIGNNWKPYSQPKESLSNVSELCRLLDVVVDGLTPDPTFAVAVDDHCRAIVGRLEPQMPIETVPKGSALAVTRYHQNQEYDDIYYQNDLTFRIKARLEIQVIQVTQ